jgi:hypothetical protein
MAEFVYGRFIGNTSYVVTVNGSDVAGNVLTASQWTFSTANVGAVDGIIEDMDGHPLNGALVTLKCTSSGSLNGTAYKTETTISNSIGYYVFYDVPVGDYTITVDMDNYTSQVTSFSINSDRVALGGITVDVSLTVHPASMPDEDSPILLPVLGIAFVTVALAAIFMIRKRRTIKP